MNLDLLFEIEKRIERRNARKIRRSRLVAEKMSWQDLTPLRFRRLRKRAARLARSLETLESRRQDILRRLKIKLLKVKLQVKLVKLLVKLGTGQAIFQIIMQLESKFVSLLPLQQRFCLEKNNT